MSDWKHTSEGMWVRRYDPTPAPNAPPGYVLRVFPIAGSTRFAWEVWRGATLVNLGEADTIDDAKRAARDLADTKSGAPRRVEVPVAAEETSLSPFSVALRFVAAAVLVAVAAWQFTIYQATGDPRGFAVAAGGIVSVLVLAIAARLRR